MLIVRMQMAHSTPEKRLTVDGLLWHVIIHEIRHAARIAVLLRRRASTRYVLTPNLKLMSGSVRSRHLRSDLATTGSGCLRSQLTYR